MTDQEFLFTPIPNDKYSELTKEDLIVLQRGNEQVIEAQRKEIERLQALRDETQQKSFLVEEKVIVLKGKLFGKSSEKFGKKKKQNNENKAPKKKVKLPSDRYPNAPIIEKDVTFEKAPECTSCGENMEDSGMTEDSQYLTAIPREFFIVLLKRHKYRCSCCHDSLVTAPLVPRIKVGGAYSDEMMIDVVISKYCDLMPVERYKKMAERDGIKGLPANSLINCTHNVADFVEEAANKVKDEVMSSRVLHSDETTHRMLEGDENPNWYLWGFSTDKACYFETHGTRSGDVASEILKNSKCEYYVTDVYSGHKKAVRVSNEYRLEKKLPQITNINCNAHARRKFSDALEKYETESSFFLWCYQKIYRLEKAPDKLMSFERKRQWQDLYFRVMKRKAEQVDSHYSAKSLIVVASKYFLKNYEGLTHFLGYDFLPIDNNSQERLIRNPVIGRKTWFGTHSKKGAKTASILFTLVESCKLNQVNPREYFRDLILDLHQGKPVFTPAKYQEKIA